MALYTLGMLASMAVTGACQIPGLRAKIQQTQETDRILCGHTRWNYRRNAQLRKLTKVLQEDLDKYIEPAMQIAETSRRNWKLSQSLLKTDRTIMYINTAVLAVVMVVYVLLAWLALFKKRATLQQAFSAVRNIHIQS